MKRILLPLLVLIAHFAKSQNAYDTYNTCAPPDVTPYLYSGFTNYSGEYQIFLEEGTAPAYWTSSAFANNAITYKIELVSFPFTPNCINCFGAGAVSLTERILKMPDDQYPYDPIQNAWIRSAAGYSPPAPPTTTYEVKILNKYQGEYGVPSGYSDYSTLISREFIGTSSNQYIGDDRKYYPHSVLKHVFYMHCGSDPLSPAVDSFSFILDHTRGRMRNYPFFVNNNPPTDNNDNYDIAIVPSIIEGQYDNSTGDYETIDYFPPVVYDNSCPSHIPDQGVSPSPFTHIRPESHSLVQTVLANASVYQAAGYDDSGNYINSIQQQYVINRTFDLNIINPAEKIIYNPSEVSIDLDQVYNITPESKVLVFPSGYTFKTVSGIYPTPAQVAAADPDHMYVHELDIPAQTTLTCDDAGPVGDGWFANYTVKSGSTLKIESCVNLFDVRIFIENGGTVIFDNKSSVRGRYYIDGPGMEIDNAVPPTSTCLFDCHDKNKYDDRTGNIHITSDQTWTTGSLPFDADGDGIMRISGALIIDQGKTLNIGPGVRFEFGENGKLIIERQAKLLANGNAGNPVVFTSADFCNLGMWHGIEVWGDRNQKQGTITSSPQGIAKLNYAKISNARTGIATRNGNDINYNGGIIQCQNVDFENNRISGQCLSYHNTFVSPNYEVKNIGYFKNCKFLTTNYLNDAYCRLADGRREGTLYHLDLKDVNTIFVEGCLFENTALQSDGLTPLFNTDQRGVGIYSIDAGIFLTGGPKKNTFKGLSDGVWALSTGASSSIVAVTGNVFENNINGVVLEGTSLSRIEQNIFSVPVHFYNEYAIPPSYNSGYNKPVGLYLIGATDFTAEENTFNNYGPPSSSGVSPQEYNYGIVVNNCVGASEIGTGNVYKNIISDANVGLQAELDNLGSSTASGLQYKCNEFLNRVSYDAVVPSTNFPSVVSKIRNQGICDLPETQAGNFYNTCDPITDVQLRFDAQAEFEAVNNTNFIYRDQPGNISCATNPSFIVPCLPDDDNSCPSFLNTCYTISCLFLTHLEAASLSENVFNSFSELIDGGNTEQLLQQINNNNIPAGSLKNLLMNKSPYLSDGVLLATINRQTQLPPGHLKEIVVANSPLTKPVLSVIEDKNLPDGIWNEILTAQHGISLRMEKESQVEYYAFQEKLAEVKLKQAYFSVDNLDSLKIVAEKDTTLNGLFKLMEILIAKGDLSQAQVCRTRIVSKEIPHISDHCKFLSTRLNLALAGKTWFDMTPSQSSLIAQIYSNNPQTAINARAVLALTRDFKYERYPYDLQHSHRMDPRLKVESVGSQAYKLNIYPNPATNFITVELSLYNENESIQLDVYNLLGNKIQDHLLDKKEGLTISTEHLPNGIYFLVLRTDEKIIERQKVIISR